MTRRRSSTRRRCVRARVDRGPESENTCTATASERVSSSSRGSRDSVIQPYNHRARFAFFSPLRSPLAGASRRARHGPRTRSQRRSREQGVVRPRRTSRAPAGDQARRRQIERFQRRERRRGLDESRSRGRAPGRRELGAVGRGARIGRVVQTMDATRKSRARRRFVRADVCARGAQRDSTSRSQS